MSSDGVYMTMSIGIVPIILRIGYVAGIGNLAQVSMTGYCTGIGNLAKRTHDRLRKRY